MDGDEPLGAQVDSAYLPRAFQKPPPDIVAVSVEEPDAAATQADLAAAVVALKAWVRQEIEMKAMGLTDAERKALNE